MIKSTLTLAGLFFGLLLLTTQPAEAETYHNVTINCPGGGTARTTIVFDDNGRVIESYGVDCDGKAWSSSCDTAPFSPPGGGINISVSPPITCSGGGGGVSADVYLNDDGHFLGATGYDCDGYYEVVSGTLVFL